MYLKIIFFLYILIVGLSFILGVLKLKHLDMPAKLILLLLISIIFSEILTRYVSSISAKNSIYHIYSIVEISLTTFYFLEVLSTSYKRYRLLILIGWISIGTINSIYFQPLTAFNTNILMIEGFTIITMAIYLLYRILINDFISNVLIYPHFWFGSLFLLLWTSTFFYYPIIGILSRNKWPFLGVAEFIQAIVDIIVYAGIGIIFLLYPKMQQYIKKPIFQVSPKKH